MNIKEVTESFKDSAKELDLSKITEQGTKTIHPDIDLKKKYLVLLQGRWHLGLATPLIWVLTALNSTVEKSGSASSSSTLN